MRLNLGCGNNKATGFVNVDMSPVCEPDQVVDLEVTPWPWADDSAEEVVLFHVLEHLGRETKVFMAIMLELYRVCRDGAMIHIAVPHPRHDHFLGDPTHVRPILPQTLALFSRAENDRWRRDRCANTQLAYQLGVDFEMVQHTMELDEPYRTDLAQGRLTEAAVRTLALERNNIATEFRIDLKVHKHAPAPAAADATAFLLEADWSGSDWKRVLHAYLEAFAPGEPVALVVQLGATPALKEVEQLVLGAVQATGRERFPDVILVEASEPLVETLRRFRSIQWAQGTDGGAVLTGVAGTRLAQALKRA